MNLRAICLTELFSSRLDSATYFLTSYNLKYILLQRFGYTMLSRFVGEYESEETIRQNDKVSFESCKLFSVQTVLVCPVVV